MKKIEAIVRPNKVDDVKDALDAVGCPSMTVTEVRGRGQQKGITQQWRGREYCVDLLPKTKIEVVVHEKNLKMVMETIRTAASTDSIGDGKIFVTSIDTVMRIRTGETDRDAL